LPFLEEGAIMMGMNIIRDVSRMSHYAERLRTQGKTIGFVPTMGALHEGHLSLVRVARKECEVCVMSIFVNPLQFGPHEDFKRYPRPWIQDRRLAEQAGVDVLFQPSAEEMYPNGEVTCVEPPLSLTSGLCGAFRPGHFRGVATVVTKLFHIVKPTHAYFGQKDAQQCAVIRQMIRDLNFDIRLRVCPLVREPDGLAMSSRNQYLSPRERQAATVLFRALQAAAQRVRQGERSAAAIRQAVASVMRQEPLAHLEYVEVVHPDTLTRPRYLSGRVMIAMAAWIGKTRLIDNIILRVP